jgi:hypothetical protein
MTASLEGRVKSLSFAVRSPAPEVAAKKVNVFAEWESVFSQELVLADHSQMKSCCAGPLSVANEAPQAPKR